MRVEGVGAKRRVADVVSPYAGPLSLPLGRFPLTCMPTAPLADRRNRCKGSVTGALDGALAIMVFFLRYNKALMCNCLPPYGAFVCILAYR